MTQNSMDVYLRREELPRCNAALWTAGAEMWWEIGAQPVATPAAGIGSIAYNYRRWRKALDINLSRLMLDLLSVDCGVIIFSLLWFLDDSRCGEFNVVYVDLFQCEIKR